MKVICISDKWLPVPENRRPFKYPVIGQELTVVWCGMFEGEPEYLFSEIPTIQNNTRQFWRAVNFAPLDTYKESEIEQLKEELSLK